MQNKLQKNHKYKSYNTHQNTQTHKNTSYYTTLKQNIIRDPIIHNNKYKNLQQLNRNKIQTQNGYIIHNTKPSTIHATCQHTPLPYIQANNKTKIKKQQS